VVNERVDYKTLHSEMVAQMATQDRKSSLLEASLLEKDAQLEAVQAQLLVGGWRLHGNSLQVTRIGDVVWSAVGTVEGPKCWASGLIWISSWLPSWLVSWLAGWESAS